jgi:flavin-binding protein dodecin
LEELLRILLGIARTACADFLYRYLHTVQAHGSPGVHQRARGRRSAQPARGPDRYIAMRRTPRHLARRRRRNAPGREGQRKDMAGLCRRGKRKGALWHWQFPKERCGDSAELPGLFQRRIASFLMQKIPPATARTDYDVSTPITRSRDMSNHVYKSLELTGSSPIGIEDAVQTAIAKAHETVRNIQWFTVTETRGHVVDGKIAHWQVTVKIGFTLE